MFTICRGNSCQSLTSDELRHKLLALARGLRIRAIYPRGTGFRIYLTTGQADVNPQSVALA